jgi:DNA-binding response OmpR family regulator
VTTLAIVSGTNGSRIGNLFEQSGYETLIITDTSAISPGKFTGAAVDATGDLDTAVLACRSIRKLELPGPPILLLIERHQVKDLALRESLFDDFAVSPFDREELSMRIRHLLIRFQLGDVRSRIAYGPLVLDVDTYQATLEGKPLDLTYMEYELLKFLASHPGKVFSRETLLSRVWGYEYYGGARTVDVHIRRLRAKLGEAHEQLIQTVRSVGYRFGSGR